MSGIGRVDVPLGAPGAGPSFSMFDDSAADGREGAAGFARGAVSKTMQTSRLSDLFFSSVNVNALQHGIRYRVFNESRGQLTIGRQSDVELGIVMQSVYLTYGRNDDRDVVQQVRTLNAHVLDYAVPQIMREANMYKTYRQDISRLPVPLERGQLATSKGERQLEMGSIGF